MVLNIVPQLITFGIAILIVFGITYVIDIFLVKVKKILVFALPALFFVVGVLFFVLGLLSDDWGALGFLLYGSFSAIAFVGSLIAGLVMWFRKK
ncbi:MAG: hypothetical protein RBQ71_02735 [Acholeplasmataceae bacterium]|jgi:hypothetical protein|nr:hypothetical protein [Acholeplasmataceae bacterium]